MNFLLALHKGWGHTLYIFIQKNPNVCDLRVSTNICSDITWISVTLLLTYTDTAKQTWCTKQFYLNQTARIPILKPFWMASHFNYLFFHYWYLKTTCGKVASHLVQADLKTYELENPLWRCGRPFNISWLKSSMWRGGQPVLTIACKNLFQKSFVATWRTF